MQVGDIGIHEWPESLDGVLDGIEKAEHEPYSEMRMDGGHVQRRKLTTSPIPLFRGDALVSEAQWAELRRLVRRVFSFTHPSSEGTVYGLLADVSLRSTAVAHWTGSKNPPRRSYNVEILFEDKTQQVLALMAPLENSG